MSEQIREDVMGSLLSEKSKDDLPSSDDLNSLIYRDPTERVPILGSPQSDEGEQWQSPQDNVSVQIWETRANIKIKVSGTTRKHISMNRIADIAVKAITEELKKEDQ